MDDDIREQLSSITECSICAGTYSDPRQLPTCGHTYCLQCIEGFTQGNRPGSMVPCPLCRTTFRIPMDGVNALRTNIYVAQMLDTLATTRSKHISKLNCSTHPNKVLDLFCRDCSVPFCTMCLREHRTHDHTDISEVADSMRTQMTEDMGKLLEAVAGCREVINLEEKNRLKYNRNIEAVSKQVCNEAEWLKTKIDQGKTRLLQELASYRSLANKQIDHVVKEADEHASLIGSLVEHMGKLRDNGIPCDVVSQRATLHDRAEDLVKLDVIWQAANEFESSVVSFSTSTWSPMESIRANFVGRIIRKRVPDTNRERIRRLLHRLPEQVQSNVNQSPSGEVDESCPILKHVIPSDGRQVVGLTSINNQLFVLRHPSEGEIQVYETVEFAIERTVRVAGLNDLASYYGLAACVDSNSLCLYVSDCVTPNVRKVDLSKDDNVVIWRINDLPYGLSVSRASHVIVACHAVDKLLEYTARGSLVRAIQLHPDVGHPLHAVQLTSGKMVVSCRGPEYDVCVVDADGSRVASYGKFRRPDEAFSVWNLFSSLSTKVQSKLLDGQTQLAVDASDAILFVESDTGRMVLLDTSLNETRELILPMYGGSKGPVFLHFVESDKQLFIGESTDMRVLVFDNVSLKRTS